MRAIVQRVLTAKVEVEKQIVGQIERGWLVFLGVGQGDESSDLDYIVDRIVKLRAFSDVEGKMNLSIDQIDGSLLIVSQFTLYGDCSSRRPGFKQASHPDIARQFYELACGQFRTHGLTVATGVFGADMQVTLTNDGPVTFWLDSRTR